MSQVTDNEVLARARQLVTEGRLKDVEELLLPLAQNPSAAHAERLRAYSMLIRISAESRTFDRISAYIEEIKKIPVRTDDEKLNFARCLHATGVGWYYSGDLQKSRENLKDSLALAQELKAYDLIFYSELSLLEVLRQEGRYQEAFERLGFMRELSAKTQDSLTANAHIDICQGDILRKKGGYHEAIEALLRALGAFSSNKNSNEYHHILWSLGTCYAAIEDKEKAKIYLDLARNSHQGVEFWRINIMSLLTLAELHTILGEFVEAENLYKQVETHVGNDESSYFGRRLLRGQTLLAIRRGEFTAANDLIDRLVILAVRENNNSELMRLRLLKAEVLLRNGESSGHEEAQSMLQEALAFFQTIGSRRHQASCLELLARLDSSSGYPSDALKKIEQTLELAADGSHERLWVRGKLAKMVLVRKLGKSTAIDKVELLHEKIRKLNLQAERVILARFDAAGYDDWIKDLNRLDVHSQRYVNEFFEDFHFVPNQTVDLEIDSNSHYVREKHLGEIPFHNKFTLMKLLLLLAETPGKEFSKEALAKEIWNQEYNPLRHDNNIYININRLRKLIEPNPRESRYVMNGSRGYYFNPAMKVNISTKIADTKPRTHGVSRMGVTK